MFRRGWGICTSGSDMRTVPFWLSPQIWSWLLRRTRVVEQGGCVSCVWYACLCWACRWVWELIINGFISLFCSEKNLFKMIFFCFDILLTWVLLLPSKQLGYSMSDSVSIGKLSVIKTALKYVIVVKSKHCLYWQLLTHKLIAISVFIAVQTGTFSKCKIFSQYRKINSPHSFKNLEVNQNQFIVPIKNFLWQTSI